MSFTSYLRTKFLPAAAGLTVMAGAVALPFGVAHYAEQTQAASPEQAQRGAAIGAFFMALGGLYAGLAASEKTRRRLNGMPQPRSEAEVVEHYLLEKTYGRLPLINATMDVRASGNDFILSIRNGIKEANAKRADGKFPFHSVPAKLERMGFGLDGVHFEGGGNVIYLHAPTTERLHYRLDRSALPAALSVCLAVFNAAPSAPAFTAKPLVA